MLFYAASKKGFTLIELSIVMVIIGFITGGVLVGRNLIAAAEMRSQVRQLESFTSSLNAFRIKYNFLPGDIPPSQTSQLGFFTFTGPYAGITYLDYIGPTEGYMRFGFGNASGDIEYTEKFAFWQHLSQANLIDGRYGGGPTAANRLVTDTSDVSGVNMGGTPVVYIGVNGNFDLFVPKTKFFIEGTSDKYIQIETNRNFTNILLFPRTSLVNYFVFYVTPFQQYSIDSKMDDGLPDKGKIRDYGTMFGMAGTPPCVKGTTPNAYDLTPATVNTSTNTCSLAFFW